MSRSLVDQLLQVGGSVAYSDAVSSVNTAAVAEAQESLEGDMNVMRTLLKGILGSTHWYDAPDMSVTGIASKRFLQAIHPAGFDNVSVSGSTTTAFDTSIKAVADHNAGGGTSLISGVVVNSTLAYRLTVRDHTTQNPIDDGAGNTVYGRLTYTGGNYVVSFYSNVSGTETAYTFSSAQTVDVAFIYFSRRYEDLTWEQFLDGGWYDESGLVGNLPDDNVTVDGMQYLFNGLTNQATVNSKADKLGHADTAGEGASLVKINDSSTGSNNYFTGDNAQAAFNELKAQLGGDSSVTYDFAENNVLADNDAVYAALNKLDLRFGDLSSTLLNEGATLVSIHDASSYFTSTNVEGALAELYTAIQDVTGWDKVAETMTSNITANTSHTVPGGKTFTYDANGANMDIYLNGQLLLAGVGNDYVEESSGTSVKFLFTVRGSATHPAVLQYMIRK